MTNNSTDFKEIKVNEAIRSFFSAVIERAAITPTSRIKSRALLEDFLSTKAFKMIIVIRYTSAKKYESGSCINNFRLSLVDKKNI